MSFGKNGTYLTSKIKPSDFWPELDLGEFQRDYKFPADYADETVEMTVKHAVIEVLAELNTQVVTWQSAGFTKLEEVPQAYLLDQFELVAVFTHAVFALAKSKLYAQLVSMTRKATSESLSSEAQENIDHWQSESKRAVKHLMGKPNITVGLL